MNCLWYIGETWLDVTRRHFFEYSTQQIVPAMLNSSNVLQLQTSPLVHTCTVLIVLLVSVSVSVLVPLHAHTPPQQTPEQPEHHPQSRDFLCGSNGGSNWTRKIARTCDPENCSCFEDTKQQKIIEKMEKNKSINQDVLWAILRCRSWALSASPAFSSIHNLPGTTDALHCTAETRYTLLSGTSTPSVICLS